MAAIEQREFRSRRGEDPFRAVFEQAAVGVAQVETKTGHFVMVNQRYCDIVGYTAEELPASRFRPSHIRTSCRRTSTSWRC